jgi:hypothetical protein
LEKVGWLHENTEKCLESADDPEASPFTWGMLSFESPQSWRRPVFSLNDLFIVGIALDLTGAALLAKGLLVSPKDIYAMTQTTFGGMAWEVTEGRIWDKVYAEFGLAYLCGGFVLQALGYLSELDGHTINVGNGRAWTALGMAIVTAIVAVAICGALRRRRYTKIAGETKALTEATNRRYEESKRVPSIETETD